MPKYNSKITSLLYFAIVILLTVPFLIAGEFVDLTGKIPINLPVSALTFICPAIAVFIFNKIVRITGFKFNFSNIFDLKKINHPFWYLVMFVYLPLMMFATFQLMKQLHISLPVLQIHLADTLILFILFFTSSAVEEIGWTKFLTPVMAKRNGIIVSGLYIGIFWALVHIIPYIQAHRSNYWIFWQCVTSILLRINMVWLFYRCGESLFAVVVFHAMINMSEFLFPEMGSHYDPFYFSVILFLVIMSILLIDRANINITDARISALA